MLGLLHAIWFWLWLSLGRPYCNVCNPWRYFKFNFIQTIPAFIAYKQSSITSLQYLGITPPTIPLATYEILYKISAAIDQCTNSFTVFVEIYITLCNINYWLFKFALHAILSGSITIIVIIYNFNIIHYIKLYYISLYHLVFYSISF